MGRLKMLVNLVILAIAAVIIWLEYHRVAEQRSRAGGPVAAPAGGPGSAADAIARRQDSLAQAIETVQNVAAQVATAANEVTGLGPAETASEAAEREAASAERPAPGAASATTEASAPQQPEPAGAPSAVTTSQADDPSLPANAVRGDGTNVCPEAYPIKGNASSRIYHLPGHASYERTVPEFCFATIEAAAAAGFRAPRH